MTTEQCSPQVKGAYSFTRPRFYSTMLILIELDDTGKVTWSDADEAWLSIDKECRNLVKNYFVRNATHRILLLQIDYLCLHYMRTSRAPENKTAYSELIKYLVQPVSLDCNGSLVIPFHEHYFVERLLVRGVTQFYGLESQVSYVVPLLCCVHTFAH